MNGPQLKLLGGFVLLVALLIAAGVYGGMGLVSGDTVKIILLGVAAAGGGLFGYGMNGFGVLKGIPDQIGPAVQAAVGPAVQAAVQAELGPICARLTALEQVTFPTVAPAPASVLGEG